MSHSEGWVTDLNVIISCHWLLYTFSNNNVQKCGRKGVARPWIIWPGNSLHVVVFLTGKRFPWHCPWSLVTVGRSQVQVSCSEMKPFTFFKNLFRNANKSHSALVQLSQHTVCDTKRTFVVCLKWNWIKRSIKLLGKWHQNLMEINKKLDYGGKQGEMVECWFTV